MKPLTLLLLSLCLFLNGLVAATPGLNYKYYEGTWSNLPDFTTLTPVKTGVSANIFRDPRNRDLHYAFQWNGFITIPADATYTFETNSDDGSKLYIGSILVVNNDGEHAGQFVTGNIALNAGVYPVTIAYFQNDGGQAMEAWWSSNSGLARQQIADNVFTIDNSIPVVPTSPANYYFSAVSGDDSRTAAQAHSAATPWKTLNRLNGFMSSLKPGDSVLFKRGETFTGSIIINQSGTATAPIVFGAYGTGTHPAINGFALIKTWTSIGNGAWETPVAAGAYLNMVTLNGNVQGMGRFPNLSAPNKGYLNLESHVSNTQITDNELGAAVNWTGAEVVIRKNDWKLDRGAITNHSGNTLTYISPTAQQPIDGYGYFIQNSPLTLDQLGEWYYNPATKKLRMFFGSANPNNYAVKASMVDTLVYINGKNYITFDNLTFNGADVAAFQLNNSSNIKIQNSEIYYNGLDGISAENCPYMSITGNTINHSNNSGIKLYPGSSNASVKSNAVRNSGIIPGMGSSNNQQMTGLFVDSSPNNNIELNTVDSSGYCGITFTGDYTIVKNNVVNYFCLTVSDGGGIYTWGGWDKVGRQITGNIVLNGIGALAGTNGTTPGGAAGIYADDRSANINITNNSIVNCVRAGVYLHNSHEMTLDGNTLYNNTVQLSYIHDAEEPGDPIRNVVTTNNIISSNKSDQFLVENNSILNDISSFGSYNSNYYIRPTDQSGIITTNTIDNGKSTAAYYDLAGWTTKYGFDQQSVISPLKIPSYTITRLIGANKFANGGFNTNIDGAFVLSSPGTATASYIAGKLDGGALQVSFNANGSSGNSVATYIDFGSVVAGKTYVINFTLLSGSANKTIKTSILQNGGTYNRQTGFKYFSLSTTRTEHQLLFTAPNTLTNALIVFEIAGSDCPFWLDNFQVYEAEVVAVNPNDYMRFEYNVTAKAKSVSLGGNYVDAKNKLYAGSINIAPFSSVVLIKQTALTTATQSVASNIVATVEAGAQEAAITMKVSPNPAHEKLQVAINLPENTQDASISIYSLSGIRLQTMKMSAKATLVPVDISALATGVYIIKINYDGHTIIKKFVKQS